MLAGWFHGLLTSDPPGGAPSGLRGRLARLLAPESDATGWSSLSTSAPVREAIQRALELELLTARQLMVPRNEIVAVPVSATPEQFLAIASEHQHSRYPVHDGSLDNIVGLIAAKRALVAISTDGLDFNLRSLLTPPVFVPHTMPAYRLLAELRDHRTHLAIVANEYGVTAGIVTMRDLIARLAGDVSDETEVDAPEVEWQPDGSARIDGLALLIDVERSCGVRFGPTPHDTVGGFLFGELGRRPQIGDAITVDGCRLSVLEIDGLRVSQARLELPTDALLDHGMAGANGHQ